MVKCNFHSRKTFLTLWPVQHGADDTGVGPHVHVTVEQLLIVMILQARGILA